MVRDILDDLEAGNVVLVSYGIGHGFKETGVTFRVSPSGTDKSAITSPRPGRFDGLDVDEIDSAVHDALRVAHLAGTGQAKNLSRDELLDALAVLNAEDERRDKNND